MEFRNKILTGHAIDVLKTLPDKSVNMCMTSPPYYGLRSYGTEPQIWGGDENCEHEFSVEAPPIRNRKAADIVNPFSKEATKSARSYDAKNTHFCAHCGAWAGELGLEPTVNLYIEHLVSVFDEVKRVLRDDGTIWINLGDSYSGGGGGNYGSGVSSKAGGQHITNVRNRKEFTDGNNIQPKSLLQIPSRFALAMTDKQWILRNEIIWKKPSCMPSSANDRFTIDFEKIFFFSKKPKYYFEQQFEKYEKPLDRWGGNDLKANGKSKWNEVTGQNAYRDRNLRPNDAGRNMRTTWSINSQGTNEDHFAAYPEKLCVTPIKAGCPEGGIVLDPFGGRGTTGIVANKLKRDFILIDIKPDYAEMSKKNNHNLFVNDL